MKRVECAKGLERALWVCARVRMSSLWSEASGVEATVDESAALAESERSGGQVRSCGETKSDGAEEGEAVRRAIGKAK